MCSCLIVLFKVILTNVDQTHHSATAITKSTEEDGMNSGIREASAEIFGDSGFDKPAVLTILRGRSAKLDIKPQHG